MKIPKFFMKVLLVTLDYPPQHGGVANYYSNLVANWPDNKIDVLDNKRSRLNNDNLPVMKWLPAIFTVFFKTIKGRYCHLVAGQILPIGTVVWLISKLLKKEYTVVFHGMDLSLALAQPKKMKLTKLILDSAKHIVCANFHTAEILAEEFEEYREKIFVVHPGINPGERIRFLELEDKIKKEHGLDTKRVMLGIGRLVKRKGFDMMIEAMPNIVEHASNAHYYIIGDGPDKEYLKNKVSKLKKEIASHVHFLGALNNKEKWAWLHHSTVFVMPAREIDGDYEGFGIVYLEAGLAGTAVVAGRSGGVEDAVEDNETGLMCDPEDPESIAESVLTVLKENKLRKELYIIGRERAIQDFNWEKQAKKFHAIINS